ncbi:protein sprouty homolog 2-like [Ptychodera flava]|uniref:protein sprouty homolog 2-like n=1 Tax=Ptychodera flava TaxID=63121 RepID=UPI00396A94C1
MAYRPPDGVVTRQPRTENNNELYGGPEILSIDQFNQNKKERPGNEYTEDPWLRQQVPKPPPIPPRRHQMNRGGSLTEPAIIPSGRLTLITTAQNGGNRSRNGTSTITHIVRSPPSFNKPPPKLPYGDIRTPDVVKPEPTPRSDVIIDDIEKCKKEQSQKNQCQFGQSASQRICQYCGRCKCAGCRNSGKLPETTLCNDRCLLSADNILETCTCLCAVKCTFYHCSSCCTCLADDHDEYYVCADKPCAISAPGQNHCCLRWTAMGIMSLFLPCLCCYWPGKGCVKLCRACYNSTHSRGCNCPPRRQELDHLL